VQRYSKRFLREIEEWSDAQAIAWSEMMTVTIANVANSTTGTNSNKPQKYICREFHPSHVGNPFAYDGKVSEEDWKIYLQENPGKLFHALKF
jgi:hypothetical protein